MNQIQRKQSLTLICGLLALCLGARAQVTTATLYGAVLDPAGAVIPGARVQATNMQMSVSVSGATNENGNFTIPFVPIGAYTVTVQASGFKVYEARNVELSAGEKVNLNISLQIGGATETVEVSAQAPLVNSVNAEQDVDLNTHRVHELPLLNRDITKIVDLGTGSSTDGTSISLNGLPPRGFSFTIDGVDASPDSEYPSLSLYQNINFIKGVSLEAVQEVHVSKNIFSAEIADTVSGNVNVITKSGTNQYHGSAFEDYESGGLDAINHLLSRGSSRIFHQFGGSVGGAIKKDKLFFFAALEGYRFNQQQPLAGQVPSLQARGAIEAALPASKPYFAGWPLPTSAEKPGDISASYLGTGVAQNTDNQGTARGDYLFNQNNRVNARYTEGRPTQLQPRINFGNPRTFDGLNRNVSAAYNSVWSPTMTGETRFGYNLDDLSRKDQFYNLSVPTITGAGLPDPSQARLFVKNGKTITAEESIAKTLGRHSLKFGGMYRFQSAQRVVGDLPTYSFATLTDIIANQPATGTYTFFPQTFNLRRWFTGFFVQDDFRVSQRLIVNAGLRWDYQSVPQEQKGLNYNRDGPFGPYRNPNSPWNNYYKMFSPRLALAWTADQKQRTVLRAGAGMFYIPMNFFEGPVEIAGIDPNVPQAATISGVQLKNLGVAYPDGNSKVQSAVKASNIIGVTAIDPNWRPSYSLQWTAGVEHAFTNTLALNVSYVANHGVRLLYDAITNRVDRVTGLPPNPGFSTFRYYQNGDSSTYESLQTSLKKRFASGLQFDIGYTYASNMSYFLGDYNCCGEDNNPQDLSALKQNRAPTLYFLRHRFTGDFVYAVPALRASNAVARQILSGWEVSGVFQAHSANPLPIIESITASPGARPDFAPGFTYQSAVSSSYRTALPNGSYQYLNTAAFIRVPTSTVSKAAIRPGNLGRNAIFGPGLWNTDLSLAKNVAFSERYKMQLRCNFFNALNHTNYTSVQTNVLSSQFGQITGVTPGRALQLVAKFVF